MKKLLKFTHLLVAVFMTTMLVTSQAYGHALFATSGANMQASTLYELDPTTGAIIRDIGPVGFSEVVSIDFHPATQVLYGISNGSNALITIDTTTGKGTFVFTLPDPMDGEESKTSDMGFAPDGTLYTWNKSPGSPGRLTAINVTTEVSTGIGSNYLEFHQVGLDVDSWGTVYVKNEDGVIYTIDRSNGAESFVTDITMEPFDDRRFQSKFDNALAVDSNNNLFTIDRPKIDDHGFPGDLYAIDLKSGLTSLKRPTGVAYLAAIAFQGEHFDTFTITKAEVKFDDDPAKEKFKAEGVFTLNPTGTGAIDPLSEFVTVKVGTGVVTIPPYSFVYDSSKFVFKGTIDGVDVKMTIEQTHVFEFKFKAEAKGVDLTGTANPLDISLDIGGIDGTASVRAHGTLKYPAKRKKSHKGH
jgi:hypothetical protein